MRITCQSCNSDFLLPPMHLEAAGINSSCPFCNTIFKVLPGEKGEPRVRFDTNIQRKLRICIECSREFEAEEEDVIPVCPNCKHKKATTPAPDKGIWKLSKVGRLIDLETSTVREWIRQGAILPDDEIVAPSGGTFPAKQFKQFSEDFREQLRKSRRPAKFIPFVSRRPLMVIREIGRWGALAAAIAALVWVGWRIVTFKPAESAFNPEIRKFVDLLRPKVPPATASPDLLLRRALSEMAKDRPDSYEEAVTLLEQAVVGDGGRSLPILGTLAEAYALSCGATDDPRFRVAASGLAGLVVRSSADRVEGYVARARSALNAGDFVSARADVQKGLSLDPLYPRLLLVRARTLLSGPQNPLSLEDLVTTARTVLKSDPSLVEAYDVAGEAFMNAGDPSAALHEFELRIKSSRDDAKALYRLGELEERAGRLKPAREWYQHALRQGPELVAPRLHLAFIHERADGNFPAAERHVREILTRYRRFASSREIFLAQVELIRILSRSERAPEALELLGHFPADFTTAPLALLTKAELYAASGRTQDATAAYRDFSGPAALNAYARVQLGLLLSSKGEIDDAVRAFRDAIGLEPRDLPAYLHAVRVLTDAKRPTEALEVANIAVSRGQMLNMRDHYEPFEETRDPLPWKSLSGVCERLAKTQKEQYSAYAFLGLCRLQEGIDTRDDAAIKKGLQALTRARQLNEGHEFVRLYFGRAHLMLGNHAKAREAFEESLRLNPLNPAARYGLAESYAATRQAGKAQAELARIIADPDWGARALNLSGEILARQKRGAEARDHWKAALKADPFFLPPWKSLLAAKAPR